MGLCELPRCTIEILRRALTWLYTYPIIRSQTEQLIAQRAFAHCAQRLDERETAVAARLQDKVAILTGAASGIGEAVAQRYLDEGARCVLVDVKPAGEFAQQLRSKHGERVLTLSADVTKR